MSVDWVSQSGSCMAGCQPIGAQDVTPFTPWTSSKCHPATWPPSGHRIKVLTGRESFTSAQAIEGSTKQQSSHHEGSYHHIHFYPSILIIPHFLPQFFALIALLPLALCDAEADPGYGRGRYAGYQHRRHYAPQCRTVYDTITEQVSAETQLI